MPARGRSTPPARDGSAEYVPAAVPADNPTKIVLAIMLNGNIEDREMSVEKAERLIDDLGRCVAEVKAAMK